MKRAYVGLLAVCVSHALLALSLPCFARPVSYPGGITIMQMNDADRNTLHLHYSPSIRYSIGYKYENWREDHWQFHGLQANFLAKRWNKPQSQANFYVKSGLGVARFDLSEFDDETLPKNDRAAGFIGLAADWEDRRFFVSYENRITYTDFYTDEFMQGARIGIAPYVGDYGDLHTWVMLQAHHHPGREDSLTLTPLIRLFKSDYLAEVGIDENGDALFNFIIRF